MPVIERVRHIEMIDKLGIIKDDVVIICSGVMALLGLRENHDLDLLVHVREYVRLQGKDGFEHGVIEQNPQRRYLRRDNVEIYLDMWPDIGFSKEEIFRGAREVKGYKFLSIGMLLRWKLKMGREKDISDIRLLWERYHSVWHEVDHI